MCIKLARRGTQGWTFIELMVTMGIFGMAALALSTLLMFSVQSLAAMANYAELDKENREAMDKLTREIRQARQVTACSSNSITILNGDNVSVTYSFQPSTKRMIRSANDGSGTQVLLNDCDLLEFGLFQRNPIGGSYDIYPVATSTWQQTVKVVQLTWRTVRSIPGTPVVTSENVQTARIVIRKQQNEQ
jgi:prepilin-type N-terminal cleavage/methylation domain-containing protein